VKRYVRKLRGETVPEARVVITTVPGEEAQVDYGEGPIVRDIATGKYRRTRLFVFTLGYSRKSVRLIAERSSTRIWAELHERAFRRLGGVVRVVVQDNLREGVLTPDIYDPTLNPLYRDMLAHYGAVALPCRVRDPDRKGKVESGVGHAQKTPLKGLRFESVEAAQAYLDRWETNWADGRIYGSTKRQVARCLPTRNRTSASCRSSRFATTSTTSAPCTSTAASRSMRRTAARRHNWTPAHAPRRQASPAARRARCIGEGDGESAQDRRQRRGDQGARTGVPRGEKDLPPDRRCVARAPRGGRRRRCRGLSLRSNRRCGAMGLFSRRSLRRY